MAPEGTPDRVVDIDQTGTPDRVVDVDDPTSYVSSFNGRSGGVSPQQADYDGFFLTQTEGDALYTRRASIATYAARAVRTSGALTLNSTTWANLDTDLDLVLSAAIGDWVEVSMSLQWASEAVIGGLDVVSLVAGAPVNSWADNAAPTDTNTGVAGWRGQSGVLSSVGGSIIRQLVAGDISAGTVTLRFRYRTTTAANKQISAAAPTPLIVWARNHG